MGLPVILVATTLGTMGIASSGADGTVTEYLSSVLAFSDVG